MGSSFRRPRPTSGISPRSQDVAGWGPIWIGQGRGGLTRYWGGSTLPFTKCELTRWPISTADLHPYYRRIADLIGIAGRRDALNRYFTDDFVNRPPIRVPAVVEALEALAAANNDRDFDLFAGVSRLAVETRDTQAARCVYCGQCMTGCFTDAVYSSLRDLDRFTAQGLIRQTIAGKWRAFKPRTGSWSSRPPAGRTLWALLIESPDLCAGCLGSIEIGMRSVGRRDGPVMTDNAIYTFPIFDFGSADWGDQPRPLFRPDQSADRLRSGQRQRPHGDDPDLSELRLSLALLPAGVALAKLPTPRQGAPAPRPDRAAVPAQHPVPALRALARRR